MFVESFTLDYFIKKDCLKVGDVFSCNNFPNEHTIVITTGFTSGKADGVLFLTARITSDQLVSNIRNPGEYKYVGNIAENIAELGETIRKFTFNEV